jgi:hypothetical protein
VPVDPVTESTASTLQLDKGYGGLLDHLNKTLLVQKTFDVSAAYFLRAKHPKHMVTF